MAMNCKASERFYKNILRDIYDSEEMKIESERCKVLKSTIDSLCTEENVAFYSVFKKIREEIDLERKKSSAKRNLFQACYMYQAERLPVVLQQLAKEHKDAGDGNIDDCILWQVASLLVIYSIVIM